MLTTSRSTRPTAISLRRSRAAFSSSPLPLGRSTLRAPLPTTTSTANIAGYKVSVTIPLYTKHDAAGGMREGAVKPAEVVEKLAEGMKRQAGGKVSLLFSLFCATVISVGPSHEWILMLNCLPQ